MLKNILKVLKDNEKELEIIVPSTWTDTKSEPKDIKVNAYKYYAEIIEEISKQKQTKQNKDGGNWIKDSVLYSAIVRATTAYDHNGDKKLEDFNHIRETGTFLKSILILPYLKKIGVDVFYMLPITKFSKLNKKGDLGSPYGVSNFYKFDEALDDPILEGQISLEDQFKAFVEACHNLDIKVIIDIIPRTNALVNDFVFTNPDWFYWVDLAYKKKYKPPFVEEFGRQWVSHTVENLNVCYQDKSVKEHLAAFRLDPRTQQPEEWAKFIEEYKAGGIKDGLAEIENRFKLTIAPAFSDGINDPQPPWTDITFFRMYLDHPASTAHNVTDDQAPYVLFDTIKSNLFPGKKPNMELWNMISDVIPYFQKEFKIDGARIDMGHALPHDLTDLIIKKARKQDKDFCFIAEEMNSDNSEIAKKAGYNLIIGDEFMSAYEYKNHGLTNFIKKAQTTHLPMFAAAETHDTGRVVARDGGKDLANMVMILNMLIPNTVPFINSGQEFYEIQPINTGINCRENEAKLLDKNDPYFGKLALFDKYQFHYLNDNYLINKMEEFKNTLDRTKLQFVKDHSDKEIIKLEFKNYFVIANNNDKDTTIEFDGDIIFSTCDNKESSFNKFELKIIKK